MATSLEYYEIRVRGQLDPSWSAWFGSLTVTPLPNGETLLADPRRRPPRWGIMKAQPWLLLLLSAIGGAAVVYQRTSQGACAYCGRADQTPQWTTPTAAARWGKWATYLAVLIPVLYAATRWAWALGIPLGVLPEFLQAGQAEGAWWDGAALGAILTLGLIEPWGERFPRWWPWLSGKRVPIALAVIPASFVAILVTTAGLMFVRLVIAGNVGIIVPALVINLGVAGHCGISSLPLRSDHKIDSNFSMLTAA